MKDEIVSNICGLIKSLERIADMAEKNGRLSLNELDAFERIEDIIDGMFGWKLGESSE